MINTDIVGDKALNWGSLMFLFFKNIWKSFIEESYIKEEKSFNLYF